MPSAKDLKKIEWLDEPEKDDYPAAETYLSLMFPKKEARKLADALRDADVVKYQAKDIFRASGLALLDASNPHVERDLKKIRARTPLSPLLLVRVPELAKVVIADGYHRLCAVYTQDDNAVIPCKIA